MFVIKKYFCWSGMLLFAGLIACNQPNSKVPYSAEPKLPEERRNLEFLQAELKRSPSRSDINLRLALHFSQNNKDSALYYANRALQTSKNPQNIYHTIARVYTLNDDPEKAAIYALKAEENGLISSDLKNMIAEQYIQDKNWVKAELYIRQAMELSRENDLTRFLKAKVDLFKGDTASALSTFKKIVNSNFSYETDRFLASIYESTGDDTLALYHFAKAWDEDDSDEEILRTTARILDRMQRKDSALTILKKRISNHRYDDYMLISEIYYDKYIWDSTLRYVQLARAYDPENTDNYMLEAKVHAGRSNYSRARAIYADLVQRDSSNTRALEALEDLDQRVSYIMKQREEQRKIDSAKFKTLPIKRF